MSRLLIDENLPFSLVRLLSVDCVHASEIAAQASDTVLWNTARKNSWMVLTRDTDFFDRLLLHGAPPKVIWVRLGNVRKISVNCHLPSAATLYDALGCNRTAKPFGEKQRHHKALMFSF